ncbi:uncharacterized protein LOC123311639 [Coccinella septempunctata]|uniref:uncharacterized protein LOC123311639 n=1 Tax=Coccinella septempunctata TaxID=41139 RepID=UPI001D0657D8|nr:uncharacterized protein LOC123311639 [Coccinella septempunctata]
MPNTTETDKRQTKLKALESKKQMFFLRLQKLSDYIKDLNKPKVAEYFRMGLYSIETTKQSIMEVVEEINMIQLDINPDSSPNYQAIEAAEDLYCRIKLAADQVEKGSLDSSSSSGTISKIPLKPQHKLPAIELVDFNGDPKVWPIFYQNFKSCVHENAELDDACKIHYLLSKLSGRALTICSGIPPIANNYESIWKLLINTYQDERLLASTYLRSIFEFKPITVESSNHLNHFLEKFDVSVSAFKQLNVHSK